MRTPIQWDGNVPTRAADTLAAPGGLVVLSGCPASGVAGLSSPGMWLWGGRPRIFRTADLLLNHAAS
jgi:hypothetical protein